MVLTAESPGFAQRNFTESVAVISAPSREYMATTCLHRQQPDLNMHAHFASKIPEEIPSISDTKRFSCSVPSYICANREVAILA